MDVSHQQRSSVGPADVVDVDLTSSSWQDVMKWVRVAVATRCSSVTLHSASEAHQPVIIHSINAVDPLR